MIDYINKRYGRLVVIKYSRNIGNYRAYFCICDCGNVIERKISLLRNNKTKSCGCLRRDKPNRTTHGMCGTNFYNIFKSIKQRCNNTNDLGYKGYGGRGIKCLWENFEEFKKDMYKEYKDKGKDKKIQIDRIDNSGNYCKENCRWVSSKINCNNTRKNRIIKYKNISKTLSEWSEYLNIKRSTLSCRINTYKWTIKEAFCLKVKIGNNQKLRETL